MTGLSRNVLLYGSEPPLPSWKTLRAGPISMQFGEGELRSIRLGEREILRRVYLAVRDHNWGTVPARVVHLREEIGSLRFRLEFDLEARGPGIHFAWKVSISGGPDGTVHFVAEGLARSTFLKNRIGFCVLHPAACAGVLCRVEHVDGSSEDGRFPGAISPHQPFVNLRALTHLVTEGVQARVEFSGDVFEMEDQRNWTDASFKTYSTPLSVPYPVEIRAGNGVSQSVRLTLEGEVRQPRRTGTTSPEPVRIDPVEGAAPMSFPAIGLGMASHGQPLTGRELERLRRLRLSHLRVDLYLSDPNRLPVLDAAGGADGNKDQDAADAQTSCAPGDAAARSFLSRGSGVAIPTELERAASEAAAIGAGLEVAVFLSDRAEHELRQLAESVKALRVPVARWLIFHQGEKSTSTRWVHLAREHLAECQPAAPFGGGTNAYFAELNRSRPHAGEMDLVCYSINPQVHSFDNDSIMETPEAHGMTVENARQFCGPARIAVSPVTLRPRINPDATGTAPIPPGSLPPQVDLRQMSLFCAAWTVASLKQLAEAGVHSVTFFETTGWCGVMETQRGSPHSLPFRSIPGAAFPVYQVLAAVGQAREVQVIPTASSDALRAAALCWKAPDGSLHGLVANLSREPQEVELSGFDGCIEVRVLDETTAEEAMVRPEDFAASPGVTMEATDGSVNLRMNPYGVCFMSEQMA